MKAYGVNELREMFLSFFESKDHLRLPSFSLVPQNDKSILLINAGMTPMKPWFKGEQVPPRKRVCTCISRVPSRIFPPVNACAHEGRQLHSEVCGVHARLLPNGARAATLWARHCDG